MSPATVYTCPNCDGTGALRVVEGSGWRLDGCKRCNSTGTVGKLKDGERDINSP